MNPPWYEDDEAWGHFEPVVFSPDRLAAAPREVAQVSALLDLAPGSDVLDLCCGIGRHALELARNGHRVVGVDRTERFLARARERAGREGLTLELVRQQMDRFRRARAFDAAISLYTSFGYHEDPERDRATLLNLAGSLRPGGKLVIELHGKEEVAASFRGRARYQLDAGRQVVEEAWLREGGSRSDNHWTIVIGLGGRSGDERHEFRFTLRLYSAPELERLLRDCGFSRVDLRGDLDGRPYDSHATHLVAVATL